MSRHSTFQKKKSSLEPPPHHAYICLIKEKSLQFQTKLLRYAASLPLNDSILHGGREDVHSISQPSKNFPSVTWNVLSVGVNLLRVRWARRPLLAQCTAWGTGECTAPTERLGVRSWEGQRAARVGRPTRCPRGGWLSAQNPEGIKIVRRC